MNPETVTLTREELEAFAKEVAADAYRMGVNDGVDQALRQMGEKIREIAQQFSNPTVRFVLMELSDALIEPPLVGK